MPSANPEATVSANPEDAPQWWRWAATFLFPGHLLVTELTMGARTEHWVMAIAFVACAWIGPRWRSLSYFSVPFWLTGVAYDNLRFLTRFRGTIHVDDVYRAEKRWFGVEVPGKRQILPEFFRDHPHWALDLICGFAYLAYLYEIVLFGIYFFFRDRERMTRLAWAFLIVNLMGIATYLIFPLAPPWYVEQYGLGPANLDALPSPAGAARFDALLGIEYFKSFYARNPNVFGAMPSLHVAYPTLAFCAAATRGRGWAIGTALFALLVAFSAVYLRHHYVLDVLAGVVYAAVAYLLVLLILRIRSRVGRTSIAPAPVHPPLASGRR